MPLRLHTFGMAASREHRVSTVMQQLGQPLYEALGVAGDELFVDDYAALQGTMAYRAVEQMLFPAAAGEAAPGTQPLDRSRSEEHTSELQSLMRISYAVFCLKKKKN